MQIREAAQALLKTELKRIGPTGRAALIKLWEPQLSNLLKDFEDLNYVNVPTQLQISASQMSQSTNSLSQLQANQTTGNNSEQPAQLNEQMSIRVSSSRIRRKQYVAIIILSLIGAEFGQDINSNQNQTPYKTIPQGFSLEDHSILKRISKIDFDLKFKENIDFMRKNLKFRI